MPLVCKKGHRHVCCFNKTRKVLLFGLHFVFYRSYCNGLLHWLMPTLVSLTSRSTNSEEEKKDEEEQRKGMIAIARTSRVLPISPVGTHMFGHSYCEPLCFSALFFAKRPFRKAKWRQLSQHKRVRIHWCRMYHICSLLSSCANDFVGKCDLFCAAFGEIVIQGADCCGPWHDLSSWQLFPQWLDFRDVDSWNMGITIYIWKPRPSPLFLRFALKSTWQNTGLIFVNKLSDLKCVQWKLAKKVLISHAYSSGCFPRMSKSATTITVLCEAKRTRF